MYKIFYFISWILIKLFKKIQHQIFQKTKSQRFTLDSVCVCVFRVCRRSVICARWRSGVSLVCVRCRQVCCGWSRTIQTCYSVELLPSLRPPRHHPYTKTHTNLSEDQTLLTPSQCQITASSLTKIPVMFRHLAVCETLWDSAPCWWTHQCTGTALLSSRVCAVLQLKRTNWG